MPLIYIESPDQVNIYYDEQKRRVRCLKRPDGPLYFDVPVKKIMPLTPGNFGADLEEDETEEIEKIAWERYGDRPFSSRSGAYVQTPTGTYIFWDGMGPLLRESGIDRWGFEIP